MPHGKAAGEVCVHLDLASRRCAIWGSAHYPDVCRQFSPDAAVCGSSREEAITLLGELENATRP